MKFGSLLTLALVALLALMAAADVSAREVTRAIAAVRPTEGNHTWGFVEFTQLEYGVRIVATIHGLEPDQQHGFHIHEWGECSFPDAERAGGHFDPTESRHGAPHHAERHVGDLGNIQADANGVGRYHRVDTHVTMNGEQSIIGRSVVIHDRPDDFVTQPTGDAGARLACGVIGIGESRE